MYESDKIYSRSVNHFHEPYSTVRENKAILQFVRTVRFVRIDKLLCPDLNTIIIIIIIIQFIYTR
jgi:hypothetical protein